MKKSQSRRIPLYSDTMDELFLVDDKTQISTRTLTFQVTENCNLRCTYCYQHLKRANKMSFSVAKKAIDMLFDNKLGAADFFPIERMSAIVLEFIGGEPLLEIDLIDKIVTYWVQCATLHKSPLAYRFMISMSTNGTLYREPNVQKFLQKWRGKVSLGFSIDGDKELHDSCRLFPDGSGSYDIAISSANSWKSDFNNHKCTKMTLCPQNIRFMYNAIVNLIENDFDSVAFNCVFEQGWSVSDAKILFSESKKLADYVVNNNIFFRTNFFDPLIGNMDVKDTNYCGGTGAMLAIDWKGDFFPCIRYMENALNGSQIPLSIGSVETGIAQTDVDCSRCKLIWEVTRSSQSPKKCLDCTVQSGCGWCSAYNYEFFGTPNKRTTFICDMHKARVLANAYYWNSLVLHGQWEEVFKINLTKEEALEYIDENEWDTLKELEDKAMRILSIR